MVELSKSQDIEAGDGTTSVVVLAGGLLNACSTLLSRGLHPNQISDAFQLAATKAEEVMKNMAIPVDFNDKESLIKCTTTSLSSKVWQSQQCPGPARQNFQLASASLRARQFLTAPQPVCRLFRKTRASSRLLPSKL